MIRRNIFSFLMMSLVNPVFSQSETGTIGIYYFSGTSSGVNPSSSVLNNQIVEYLNGTVQVGFYSFINLRKDSSDHAIKYVRVDIGAASRTGTFDIGNGGLARMTSTSIDITPMLPVRFKVIKGIDGYAMFGPVFSYRLRRNIVTNQTLPADAATGAAFKFGYATELGFRLGNCTLGFRAMAELNDYPTRISAVCFGFSPPNSTRRSKR